VRLTEEDKAENIADVSSSISALIKIVAYNVFASITENHDQYLTMIADAFPFVIELEHSIDDLNFF
jgi:hypothetical protein